MKRLSVDFDEVRKAMEDTDRDAFDYFLDKKTGEVIILSEEIIGRAREILEEEFDDDSDDYEEVEYFGDYDVPDWMEDEVELALRIFLEERDRYVRIPERKREDVFFLMREFTEALEDAALKQQLLSLLDGRGAFRSFKDALAPYPKERKQWYGFSAKKAKQEIEDWIRSLADAGEQEDDMA